MCCVVTHKAQNHRYHAGFIGDFTLYVNWQIVTSNYAANANLNFDVTDIVFDPSPRSTLSKVGERSTSIHNSRHSGRYTFMLGSSASDFKFPGFVIWKGVPNGPIDRERLKGWHIQMATSLTPYKQRDGWMFLPTKAEFNAS
jgi:hypothetical protein